MKRYLTTALAAALLASAMTGCVPLELPSPASSPVAEPLPVEPIPGTPVPNVKTYSTVGLAERVSGLSKSSPARAMLEGTFTYDSAVPGSVQLLYAEKSEGGQRAIIRLDDEANAIGHYVWCAEEARYSLDIADGTTGSDYGAASSSCNTSGASGGSGGLPDGVGSVFVDFAPSAEVSAEVIVFSYTRAPFDG
ncbi:hypothetical protein Q2T94_13670 [Paeniglutamicibacter sulfureus]|uniref:hypothetical protein n=1 Tax=Paeniglutamicibacter sulfureus TaxID=43666 RepID=UPI0026667287|nr:hypothetical protein [Paeniglutamicibacter sulfureus]MDO2935356.1 hypothetical protein [Paeniglutamicibacter sulfureus]